MAATGTKRNRIVEAARACYYRQGVQGTTLADIAAEATIPLGNVYYYFKTKESLTHDVIALHLATLSAWFGELEYLPDPRQRLRQFLRDEAASGAEIARYGCPYGSLCQELGKTDDPDAISAADVLTVQLRWIEAQFRLLDQGERAPLLASDFLASLQGALLLTNTFHAPALLVQHLDRLEAWLDTVLQPTSAPIPA